MIQLRTISLPRVAALVAAGILALPAAAQKVAPDDDPGQAEPLPADVVATPEEAAAAKAAAAETRAAELAAEAEAKAAAEAENETAAEAAEAEGEVEEKPRVAVMGVQVVGFPDAVRELFTESLAQGAARNEAYSVLSQAEITSILGLEAQKQLLGCSDSSCLAELAGALDAAYLITGKVVKLGAVSNLSVSMVDLAETKALRREHMEVEDDGQLVKWLRFLGAKVVGVDPGDDLAKDVGFVTGPRWRISAGLGLAGLGTQGPIVLPAVPVNLAAAGLDPTTQAVHPTLFEAQWKSNLGFTFDLGFQVQRWLRLEMGYEHRQVEAVIEVESNHRAVASWMDGSEDQLAANGLGAGCLAVFSDEDTANAYNDALAVLDSGGDAVADALMQENENGGILRQHSAAVGPSCYSNTRVQALMVGLPVVLYPARFLAFEIGPRFGFGVLTLVGWHQSTSNRSSAGGAALLLGGRLGVSFLFREAFARFPLDLSLDLRGDLFYLRGINVDEQVHRPQESESTGGQVDPEPIEKKVRIELPFPTITLGLGMRF